MNLIINQTFSRIGIERIPGKLDIETQNTKLELHQKHAKISLHTELPKVEIDQYECFASAGLKGPIDLTVEAAQLGRSQAMKYIGKVATDGDRLAAIELGGDPIPDIAERDAYPVHEFGLDFIPKARPKITVKGGVWVEPQGISEGINNGVEGEFIPGSIKFNYAATKINIYLKQRASIKFSYKGENIDKKL